MKINLKNIIIRVGIVLLSVVISYISFRITVLLFIERFTDFLITHKIIQRSLFPWILPSTILVNIVLIINIVAIFILLKNFRKNNIIKKGLNHAIIVHIMLFVYFFIMFIDAIVDLGLPNWYFF